jgi:serine/threonine protein kinase
MNPKQGLLLGDWILEHPLGGGDAASCAWWAARDREGRAAALKLGPDLDAEEAALRRLDHPGVPRVLERLRDPPALITTLVVGARLDMLGRTLADELMLPLARDVCGLIAYAHEQGVAHGDLRPERMLVDPTGRVHVLGFGARRPLDLDEVGAMTPAFAPPEWHDAQPVDPLRADAFSLGVSLHELCSGHHHRRAARIAELPLTLEGRVHELSEAVRRLTDPDPHTRWTAAQALILLYRRVTRAPISLNISQTGSSGSMEAVWEQLDEPHTDHPGDRVGRYRIVRELGRGGMGMVYEAIDEELDRRVALKLLPQGTLTGSRLEKRFLREARAVAKLEHPAIVRVLDIGRSDRGLFFAMEYIEGGTLSERLHRDGPVPWELALRWMAEAATAVQHAHERGVVHRDLKPSNLMLDRRERVHIVDFGLAFPLDEDQTAMTRTGSVLGTPMYMAPEQAMGRRDQIGPRSDVYALGVVLFELLSGRPPFDGQSSMEVLQAVAAGRGHDLDEVTRGLPRSAVLICRKAMAVDPDDRYASAALLAQDLFRASRGDRVRPTGPSWRRVAVRLLESRRHVFATVLGTMVVALSSAAAFGAWRKWENTSAQVAREVEAEERLQTLMATVEARRDANQHEEADNLLRAFAVGGEQRGTAAAWRAWTELAGSLAAHKEDDAGMAWAQAWSEAPTPELEADALLGLAEFYRTRNDFRSLGAVLRVLTDTAPARLADPTVARLASSLRVSTGTTTSEDRADPLIAALSVARPVGARGIKAMTWAPDGQNGALWAQGAEPDVIVRLGPDRAEPMPLPVRSASLLLPVPGSLFILHPTGQPATVGGALPPALTTRWALGPDGWQELQRWPGVSLRGAAQADLDADGTPEIYGVIGRTLQRLDGDVWTVVEPDTSGAGSELSSLQATDLNDDGRPELALAAQEWGAYDVRVIEGPVPHLTTRMKLGVVDDLTPWRTESGVGLAAHKVDRWPSRDVFPESWHQGSPTGLWLLRRGVEDKLEIVEPIHPPVGQTFSGLWAGDLDGDGQDELATNTEVGLFVLYATRDAEGKARGWRTHVLPDLVALGVHDSDGDGDAELLISPQGPRLIPQDLWWLGRGDQRPPLSEDVDAPAEGLPPLSDPGVRKLWQDVEKLATIGLPSAAADLARNTAAFTPVPEDRVLALRAAGRLYEEAGRLKAAAECWTDAAAGSQADADHRAAAALWRRIYDFAEELKDLGQIERPTEADNLRLADLQWLTPQPNLELLFGAKFGGPWQAGSPFGARNDVPALSLQIHALSGAILAMPIRYDGGPLQLEVTLDHESIEWGGRLRVGIGPEVAEGTPLWGLALMGSGGGGFIQQRSDIVLGAEELPSAPDVPTGARTTHTMVWMPADDVATYELRMGPDVVTSYAAPVRPRVHDAPPMPEGWLRVEVAGAAPGAVRTRIVSIRMWGARPRTAPPDPHPAWLENVAGRPDPGASDDPVDRAAALLALGDLRGAIALLLEHPEHPLQRRLLDHLLHIEADRSLPLLAQALGPALPERFAASWQGVLLSERYNPAVRDISLHPLLDVSRAAVPATDDARTELAGLLRVRVDAAIESGQLTTAAAALPLWARLGVEGQELAAPRQHQFAARIALARGDTAGAIAEIRAALAPEAGRSVVADRLKIDPALRALQEHAVWAEIGRAAAGGP